MNILIINGPNLNMLGIREIDIYGNQSYLDLVKYLNELSKKYNFKIEIFQSNSEGEIIDKIQSAYFNKVDAIIINPAAYTHYSIAIFDAIKAVNIPTIEVHLSDIYHREDFRKINVIKSACIKSFYGKGFLSYGEAVEFLVGENNEIS
ncbi:MAG: type II 3-dehydroquinate dehydratase [Bacilli bacterium]